MSEFKVSDVVRYYDPTFGVGVRIGIVVDKDDKYYYVNWSGPKTSSGHHYFMDERARYKAEELVHFEIPFQEGDADLVRASKVRALIDRMFESHKPEYWGSSFLVGLANLYEGYIDPEEYFEAYGLDEDLEEAS